MDQPERFSLQWDEFETNLRNTFAGLRRGEDFSDVTLVSEDGHLLKAHKVLLSATSSLLDTILKSQDHPKPLIFMRGAKMDVLKSLLDFIYFGQVEIRGDQLDKFMALANELNVKGLSKDENLANEKNIEENKNPPLEASVKEEESRIISETNNCTSFQEMKEESINVSADLLWENEEETKIFNCNLCEKTSFTLKGVEKHKLRSHLNSKGKSCQLNLVLLSFLATCVIKLAHPKVACISTKSEITKKVQCNKLIFEEVIPLFYFLINFVRSISYQVL